MDNDIYKSIGRIEGGIIGMNERFDRLEKHLEKNDDIISGLVNYRDTQKGELKIVAVISGFISSVVVATIVWFIKNK